MSFHRCVLKPFRALALLAGACLALSGCNCGEVAIGGDEDAGAGAGGDGATAAQHDGGGAKLDSGETPAGDGGVVEDLDGSVEVGDGGEQGDGSARDGGCPATSCQGLCGPVRDFCTDKVLQCGGCQGGLVCDLDSHVCLAPLKTCADLGAACGLVKNSCGVRLDCGECPTGKECDRNSHTCVDCTNPSCSDLGYQCGDAWLGCGPSTQTTPCGDCPTGQVCNQANNVCDPQCTPQADSVVCQAAGAECGYVGNGCGGLANCGDCPDPTTSCGARGIGNRCDLPETPNECLAANMTCGTVPSACGSTISCGTCTPPNLCGATGQCAPPCVPRTCDTTYQGHCGVALDEGCTPGKTMDCPCTDPTQVCTTTVPDQLGDCVAPATCDAFLASGQPGQACSNGPDLDFPKGDGTGLTCQCNPATGGQCYDNSHQEIPPGSSLSGTCCKSNVDTDCAGICDTVEDVCTYQPYQCTCTVAGQHCNTSAKPNKCEGNFTCSLYQPTGGKAGDPCSNGTNDGFPAGDGSFLECKCTDSSGVCIKPGTSQLADPNTTGVCCDDPLCGANECNTPKVGCLGPFNCPACSTGHYCDVNNQCQVNNGCPVNGGQPGDKCSNGPDLGDFPKGDGTGLTCPCQTAGAQCYASGAVLPNGSTSGGLCCVTDTCTDPQTKAARCGDWPEHCSGATLHCTCPGGDHCTATPPAQGTCAGNATCATYGANGTWVAGRNPPGDICSNGPSFFNGADAPNQALLTCLCYGGAQCSSGSAIVPANCGQPGTKACTVDGDCNTGDRCINKLCATPCPTGRCCENTNPTCGNQCNTSVTDSCTGATTSCTCGTGFYCSSTAPGVAGTCLADSTCATYGANGAKGNPCTTDPYTDPSWTQYPGDTVGLDCHCTGGRICSVAGSPPHQAGAGEVGTCCAESNPCAGLCNQTKNDPCTGAVLTCTCSGTTYCDTGNTNTCLADWTCQNKYQAHNPPQVGDVCSGAVDPTDLPRYPGDTTGQKCSCSGTMVCSASGHQVTGATLGACCQPLVAPAGNVGDDCTDGTDPCTGNTVKRPCATGNYCDAGTGKCAADLTCPDAPALQQPGHVCSNGNDPADFPRYPGDPTGQTCKCAAGNCYKAYAPVSGAVEGTCCTPKTCPANSCADVTDPCTNTVLHCSCSANYHCNANACVADTSCGTYGANGAQANPCSDGADSAFHDGPGNSNLTCKCSTANPWQNAACSGWTASTAGSCTCTATAPTLCTQDGQADGCNGKMSMPCTGQVCDTTTGACCTPPTCPAGASGDACTVITQCGKQYDCTGICQAPNTCGGGGTTGVCGCTPNHNCAGKTGYIDDGCGGQWYCGG